MSAYTGDNPLAKARELSPRKAGRKPWYNYYVVKCGFNLKADNSDLKSISSLIWSYAKTKRQESAIISYVYKCLRINYFFLFVVGFSDLKIL